MEKQTFKSAGYSYIKYLGNGQHHIIDNTGNHEVWISNKNHASFGLIYKNTHLEFAHSIDLNMKQIIDQLSKNISKKIAIPIDNEIFDRIDDELCHNGNKVYEDVSRQIHRQLSIPIHTSLVCQIKKD